MSILKLKAKIYQYTGLFLAYKEQYTYLQSKDFWIDFKRYYEDPNNDLGLRSIQGTLIGTWQVNYGFYRRLSTLDFSVKRKNILYRLYGWLEVFSLTLKDDLTYLKNKIKEYLFL